MSTSSVTVTSSPLTSTPLTSRSVPSPRPSPATALRPPVRAAAPVCARLPQVFQHPLLEQPPSSSARTAERREHGTLVAAAEAACAACPLVTDCLYRAVVEHDVAGFVAGTTARQRTEIRRRLGVTVAPEDFDSLAGVIGGRQVDHAEVLRLRAAHPDESLEVLAGRLGCALSTVKRHLRREREVPSVPRSARPAPDRRQVLAVAAEVTRRPPAVARAA